MDTDSINHPSCAHSADARSSANASHGGMSLLSPFLSSTPTLIKSVWKPEKGRGADACPCTSLPPGCETKASLEEGKGEALNLYQVLVHEDCKGQGT